MNKNKYITSSEVCEILSISRQTLWRWRKAGVVPKGGLLRRKTVVFTEQEFAEIQAYALQIVPLENEPAQLDLAFSGDYGNENEN
jgi:predicted DNA-binding transcriptional regulator AlpA